MKKNLLLAALIFAAGFTLTAGDAYKDACTAAKAAGKNKNWAEVVCVYERAMPQIQKPKQQKQAMMSIAEAYMKLNNPDAALKQLEKAAALPDLSEKDKYEAVFMTAFIYGQQKKIAEAKKIFEAALADAKSAKVKAVAIIGISTCQYQEDQKAEAIATVKKIVDLEGVEDKDKIEFFSNAANFLEKKRDYESAAELYKVAIGLGGHSPALIRVMNQYTRWLTSKKLFAEAETIGRQALDAALKDKAEKIDEANKKNAKQAENAAKKGKPAPVPVKANYSVVQLNQTRMNLAEIELNLNKESEALTLFADALGEEGITPRQKEEFIGKKIRLLAQTGRYDLCNTEIENCMTTVTDPDVKVRLYNLQAENCFKKNDLNGAKKALQLAFMVSGAKTAKPDASLQKKIEKMENPAPAKKSAPAKTEK